MCERAAPWAALSFAPVLALTCEPHMNSNSRSEDGTDDAPGAVIVDGALYLPPPPPDDDDQDDVAARRGEASAECARVFAEMTPEQEAELLRCNAQMRERFAEVVAKRRGAAAARGARMAAAHERREARALEAQSASTTSLTVADITSTTTARSALEGGRPAARRTTSRASASSGDSSGSSDGPGEPAPHARLTYAVISPADRGEVIV
jgi:hypothetical protein